MILVTGANGFVGRELVQRLLEAGFRVRALVRQRPPSTPAHEQLEFAVGDMLDSASLLDATRGATAVVHLAAAKSDEKNSIDVNVGGAKRLVAACRENGCRRIVNVSTLSARIPRKGLYGSTKSQADDVFRQSGLDVTTLLPSVIYGPADNGVFGTILRFMRKLPVVPVLGDGRWLSAPVHVSDVAMAIVGALRNAQSIGRDYDIGGPDLVTFDELIGRIAVFIGKPARKFHVPFALALALARILVLLPRAPITISNVLGSNQNVAIDIAPARRDLAFAPRTLAAGLPEAIAAPVAGPSQPPGELTDLALLQTDSRRIARYLLGVEPSLSLSERYARACARLGAAGDIPSDARWQFVRRHPWSLGFIDAAAALLDRESATRRRVLLMAAILEASPEHADYFLGAPSGRLRALSVLALAGARAVAAICIGLPLHFWAGRR